MANFKQVINLIANFYVQFCNFKNHNQINPSIMKAILFSLLFLPLFVLAQKTHTVGPKESIFSIGRMYDVHPRELAEFNNISFETGVKIGQVLNIPKVKKMAPLPNNETPVVNNVEQKTTEKVEVKKTTTSTEIKGSSPIYHKVEKKQTLYQISKLFPGATIDNIKKWNNLTSDGLSEGMELIVGYSNNSTKTTTAQKETTNETKPVEETKKTVVTKTTTPEKKVETITETKTEKVDDPEVKSTEVKSTSTKDFNGGFFKSSFNEKNKNSDELETGNAGIFKSTSGWEDGKYYCLHNTASAGTILKITHPVNQKTIYAKVLDVIPDLPQNKGLLLRLSNSAAEALGTTDEQFVVSIAY
jgi:LysM repeat protein